MQSHSLLLLVLLVAYLASTAPRPDPPASTSKWYNFKSNTLDISKEFEDFTSKRKELLTADTELQSAADTEQSAADALAKQNQAKKAFQLSKEALVEKLSKENPSAVSKALETELNKIMDQDKEMIKNYKNKDEAIKNKAIDYFKSKQSDLSTFKGLVKDVNSKMEIDLTRIHARLNNYMTKGVEGLKFNRVPMTNARAAGVGAVIGLGGLGAGYLLSYPARPSQPKLPQASLPPYRPIGPTTPSSGTPSDSELALN